MTDSAAFLQAVAGMVDEQLKEMLATMRAAEAAGYDPHTVTRMYVNGGDLPGIRRHLSLTVPGYPNFTAEAKTEGWDEAFAKAAPHRTGKDKQ